MKSEKYCARLFLTALFVFLCAVVSASAQTTAFTYQGRLIDGALAANGTYEMQFKLFDAVSAGTRIGSTITNSTVSVTNGVFTVSLDFGASPFAAGANRWLEIGVRKATDPPGFTILTPRQQITSSPYSLRTLSATSADGLSSACVSCVTDAQINSISGSKVSGAVANATTAGNVTATVAVSNGGTGATNATGARTNLGLDTLATVSPSGTANSTTFLRGDNSWTAISAAGAPVFASRNSSLTLNSGTYVNLISINLDLEANKTYLVEGTVLGVRGGATNGTGRFDLIYSGNATTDFGLFFNGFFNDTVIDSTPSYDTDSSPTTFGSTVSERLSVRGYMRTTSAGTLTIRGARSSTSALVDLVIREGAFLTARPLN